MKTLKLLIALCVATSISVSTANSQVLRWGYTETTHYQNSYGWACIDEPLTGDIEHTYTYMWKEGADWLKWQDRFKGTLIGDITGDIYTVSQINNDHSVSLVNVNGHWTGNWFYVQTFTIVKNGQPVATKHVLVRATGNSSTWDAKGGWTVYVLNEWTECF